MDLQRLEKEVRYQFTRSSGKGGQHVNKVSTRVELFFHFPDSEAFSLSEKALLAERLEGKLSKEGYLQVNSQEFRSQLKNKKEAWEKFLQLLRQNLVVEKPRKAVRPSLKTKINRLKKKKQHAEKKALRKKPVVHPT